jgi:O-antigen ligase/tetratricopeptide (TPR) repeat protein
MAASLAAAFFLIPLYPAFITLTGAAMPGVSVVPRPLALALLALVFALAVAWTVSVVRAPREPVPTVVPVAAFAGAAVVSAVAGFDPAAGALFVALLLGGVVWHAAILRFVRTPGALEAILRAYLLSGALASVAAIVLVVTKTPVVLYTIGHGRAIGTFVVPGELAGYLILFVPVAAAATRRGMRPRALAPVALALGAAAFVMTFSRAGSIGMAAALAALVLMHRRGSGARYAVAIVGAALVAVALVFNAHHDPSENFTRISIWGAALDAIARFPLAGTGPFEFARLYPLVRLPGGEPAAYHAHSVVLSVAAETGLIGVAALTFGWYRFARELQARLRGASPYRDFAIAIAAGLIGTWVQGLIDTSTLVIFGLWLPFMALAIASTQVGGATSTLAMPNRARVPARRTALRLTAVVACVVVAVCAFVQLASAAVYGFAGAAYAVPRHLPSALGTRMYEALERVAPLPWVETVLTEDALRRGDLREASAHAARLPLGAVRSDAEARIAATEGRTADAIRKYLDAADDEALQPFVTALALGGRPRDAHALEARIRDRLAATETRPNALADSWWRLGRLALRLHDDREAAADFTRASELAPFNTKYLLAAGLAELRLGDLARADASFSAAGSVDPADADAVAGLGLVALRRNQIESARKLSARADRINARATLANRLRHAVDGG